MPPGNVYNGPIESLIEGIITKNVNLLKMSDVLGQLPLCVARSIRDLDTTHKISSRIAVLSWKGGDAAIESLFKKQMDRIVVWGSDDAINSWKQGVSSGTSIIEHGPKAGFGVVSKAGFRGD